MSTIAPVLFLVFNRPSLTKRVFRSIRSMRPKHLFVAADGPRDEIVGEREACEQVRNIAANVDWECEVKTLYREGHLGLRLAVSSAIDWFFSHVQEGIILEDDCLPHPSFFRFASDLLEHYRSNKKIMSICGTNLLGRWDVTDQDYLFSYQGGIWGWATWKRAWELYDVDMPAWDSVNTKEKIHEISIIPECYQDRLKHFQSVYSHQIDTWDYQWLFACLMHKGMAVVPMKNLVSNIGFGVKSTHTHDKKSRFSRVSLHKMHFPLRHPEHIVLNEEYEKKLLKYIFVYNRSDHPEIYKRIGKFMRAMLTRS